MAEGRLPGPAYREEQPPPIPQQPQPGQQVLMNMNWSILSQSFLVSQKKMLKCIC